MLRVNICIEEVLSKVLIHSLGSRLYKYSGVSYICSLVEKGKDVEFSLSNGKGCVVTTKYLREDLLKGVCTCKYSDAKLLGLLHMLILSYNLEGIYPNRLSWEFEVRDGGIYLNSVDIG